MTTTPLPPLWTQDAHFVLRSAEGSLVLAVPTGAASMRRRRTSRWDAFTNREIQILQIAFEYMSDAVDAELYEDISEFWDELVTEHDKRRIR